MITLPKPTRQVVPRPTREVVPRQAAASGVPERRDRRDHSLGGFRAGQEQPRGDALGLVCSGAPQRLDWAVGWLSLAFLPRCVGPLHLDVVAATSHGTPAADLVARSVVEGPAAGLASTRLESRPGSVLGALPDRVG